MQIPQKKSNRLKIGIISSLILLAVVLMGLSYSYVKKIGIFSPQEIPTKINLKPPTNSQVQAGNDVKKQTIENDSNSTDGNSTANKQSVVVTITASNTSNGTLSIRTLIDKTSNSGTCTLTLTAQRQTAIVKTAQVQALPSGATCKGFDVPLNELVSSKTWNAQIDYADTESTGTANKVISL